jgi:hypothetical protein
MLVRHPPRQLNRHVLVRLAWRQNQPLARETPRRHTHARRLARLPDPADYREHDRNHHLRFGRKFSGEVQLLGDHYGWVTSGIGTPLCYCALLTHK